MFNHIGFIQLLLLVVLTVGLYRVRAWIPGSGLRAWHQRHTFGSTTARWPRVFLLEHTELVLAGVFLLVGGAKLIGRPDMVTLFRDIGSGQWFRYVTGTVEIVGAALLVIPFVSGASAILLGAVMIVATLIELFVLYRPPFAAMTCLSGHTFVAWARLSHRHRRWLHGDLGMPHAGEPFAVRPPSRAQSLNARWNLTRINERRRRVRQTAATGLFCATALLPARLLAQATVRDVLYDDATGQPVRGTVMLVDPSSDEPVTYAPTDSLGHVALRASRGVYQIAAVRPGWTVLSAPVSLENGEQLKVRVPIDARGSRRPCVQHREVIRFDDPHRLFDHEGANAALAGHRSRNRMTPRRSAKVRGYVGAPPLTRRCWPLTKAARSLARYSAALATSSSVPIRCIGRNALM